MIVNFSFADFEFLDLTVYRFLRYRVLIQIGLLKGLISLFGSDLAVMYNWGVLILSYVLNFLDFCFGLNYFEFP